jgi:hypothetical protein
VTEEITRRFAKAGKKEETTKKKLPKKTKIGAKQ